MPRTLVDPDIENDFNPNEPASEEVRFERKLIAVCILAPLLVLASIIWFESRRDSEPLVTIASEPQATVSTPDVTSRTTVAPSASVDHFQNARTNSIAPRVVPAPVTPPADSPRVASSVSQPLEVEDVRSESAVSSEVSRRTVAPTEESPVAKTEQRSTHQVYPVDSDRVVRPATSTGDVYVSGYFRKDGTYVPGHYRTRADSTTANNYSTQGNVNPYTGKAGTVPNRSSSSYSSPSYSSGRTYVRGYTRKDGTYVRPHYRRK